MTYLVGAVYKEGTVNCFNFVAYTKHNLRAKKKIISNKTKGGWTYYNFKVFMAQNNINGQKRTIKMTIIGF